MTAQEMLETVANGENSGVEFKRENVRPEHLAEEIVAFANFEGGMILIGVTDDGVIEGVQRTDTEQWLMNICSHNVSPAIIPSFQKVRIEDKTVAVLKVPKGPYKPYQASSGKYYIRIGSTKRMVTREALARLLQLPGMLHYDITPVPGPRTRIWIRPNCINIFLIFIYSILRRNLPNCAGVFLLMPKFWLRPKKNTRPQSAGCSCSVRNQDGICLNPE
ncbi:MAG: ATP-binding protein [Peptococcaceae bacterium]|jgi:ATP-dependent DNA helicase RecG|nr:ATP-binding protein [Peptococcaceae bacterium]